MANLNNTLVQGDLRVTGNIYGTVGDATVAASDSLLIADSSNGNLMAKSSISFTSGSSGFLKQDGSWATPTDNKVKQNANSGSTALPILLKYDATTSAPTNTVNYAAGITVTPSTSTITATNFAGNATTATTATKLLVIDQPAWSQSVSHTSYIIGWDSNNTPITNASQLVRSTRLWSTLYTIDGVSESYFYCDHLRVMSPDIESGFEPLLTESRYFTWMDVTANNITTSRVLHGIGKIGSDDTGYKTTFEGFGLLFSENKDKFLKYKSSYVIFKRSDWNEPFTDFTISDIKFRGQAYEAYQAINAQENSPLAATLGSAAQTVACTAVTNTNEYRSLLYMASASPQSGANASLAYTGWLTYNPSIDTLNIGANQTTSNRSQISPSTISIYSSSGSYTALTPGEITLYNSSTDQFTLSTSTITKKFYYDLSQGGSGQSPTTWNSLLTTGVYEIYNNPNDSSKPETGRGTGVIISNDGFVAQLSLGYDLKYRYKRTSNTWGGADLIDSSNTYGWENIVRSNTVERIVVSSSVGTEDNVIYFT